MNSNRRIMQITTAVYLALVAAVLYLGVAIFSLRVLLDSWVPIVVVLVLFWFLTIFLVMKYYRNNRKKDGEAGAE